jgi:hypothetical protein
MDPDDDYPERPPAPWTGEEADYAEGDPPPPPRFPKECGVVLIVLLVLACCVASAVWWLAQLAGVVPR